MPRHVRSIFKLLKQTVSEWIEQDVATQGAALAFYAILSIGPMFVIVLAMASFWFGDEAARRELFHRTYDFEGGEAAEAIQDLVSAAHRDQAGGWAAALAVAALFITASGVFVQLQSSLNAVWGVRRLPGRGLRNFLLDRIRSFALMAFVGALLLGSLALTAGLSAVDAWMGGLVEEQSPMWNAIDYLVSFGVVTLLFAMIFKLLPDVKIAWQDVWIGAVITALLFNLGKTLFGLYLERGSPESAYGVGGSLVVALLWIYYSSQILFFGAKFTQVYSNKYGSQLEPVSGAESVTLMKVVAVPLPPCPPPSPSDSPPPDAPPSGVS